VRGGKLQAKKSSNEPATPSDFFTHILPLLTLLKVWVFGWCGNRDLFLIKSFSFFSCFHKDHKMVLPILIAKKHL
jgi:hypothetical protein